MSAPNLVDVLLAEVDRLTPDQRDAAAERLAELLAPKLAGTLTTAVPEPDGWCDTKGAVRYLAISLNALHKLTASRAIPFEQDGPGCRCWFKRSDLDAWRRGRTSVRSQNAAKAAN